MQWKLHTHKARILSSNRRVGELRLGRRLKKKVLESKTSKTQEFLTLNLSERLRCRLPPFQKKKNSTLKLLRSLTLAWSQFKLERASTGALLRPLPSQLFFKKDITSVFQAKMLREALSRTDTPMFFIKTRTVTTTPLILLTLVRKEKPETLSHQTRTFRNSLCLDLNMDTPAQTPTPLFSGRLSLVTLLTVPRSWLTSSSPQVKRSGTSKTDSLCSCPTVTTVEDLSTQVAVLKDSSN